MALVSDTKDLLQPNNFRTSRGHAEAVRRFLENEASVPEEYIERAIETYEGREEPDEYSKAAGICERTGRPERAVQNHREAGNHYQAAVIALRHNLKDAEQVAHQSLDRLENDEQRRKAARLAERLGRREHSEGLYEEALDVADSEGNFTKAREICEEAVEDSDNPGWWENKAQFYEDLRKAEVRGG